MTLHFYYDQDLQFSIYTNTSSMFFLGLTFHKQPEKPGLHKNTNLRQYLSLRMH